MAYFMTILIVTGLTVKVSLQFTRYFSVHIINKRINSCDHSLLEGRNEKYIPVKSVRKMVNYTLPTVKLCLLYSPPVLVWPLIKDEHLNFLIQRSPLIQPPLIPDFCALLVTRLTGFRCK